MLAAGKTKRPAARYVQYVQQQGEKKHSKQLSVSFIRTIPSAPDSHRISGCVGSRSRAYGHKARLPPVGNCTPP